jgi:phosphoglycolate phosphatase
LSGMPKAILFDVDGTLVLTGGAGRRAMSRAFEDLFGIRDAFGDASLAGRTDLGILAETLTARGLACDAGVLASFRDTYIAHLASEFEQPTPGQLVMPGVVALLDALADRQDVHLALLTGNYLQGAKLKLEQFDLWRYFRCGAFGDEARDRNGMVPEALASIRASGGPLMEAADAVVIGDTPLDVAGAATAGARSVAVATGPYDVDVLRASGADVVFESLADTEAVLAALGIGGEKRGAGN